MAVVLFRIFPQQSHHNSTYRLAKSLVTNGHVVIYAATGTLRQSIESNGFQFYEIAPDDDIFALGAPLKIKTGILGALQLYRRTLQFVKGCESLIEGSDFFSKLIKDVNPDLILIDGMYKFFSFQLLKHNVKYVFVETTVSTRRRDMIPPLSSSSVPKKGILSGILNQMEWHWYFFYPNFKRAFRNYCRKIHYPEAEIDFDRYSMPGFKSVPEINTSLRAFDYPLGSTYNEYYIPNCTIERNEISCDYLYSQQYKLILASGKKNILCSFGTAAWRYPKHKNFLKALKEVARLTPTYNFVLCVEDDNLRRELRRHSLENFFVFRRIPQMEFLEVADVMINHGGLNSINECILAGIPMLICPGHKRLDQYGNAGRVKYHGIGLQGSMTDSPTTILTKLTELLENSSFKNRVIALKNTVISDSPSTQGIEFIESLLIRTQHERRSFQPN